MADKYGKILKHRYFMSQKIGRSLTKEELVHHIDGNHLNNNIKNLDLRLKELCSYDLIGFSVKSSTKNSALEITTMTWI